MDPDTFFGKAVNENVHQQEDTNNPQVVEREIPHGGSVNTQNSLDPNLLVQNQMLGQVSEAGVSGSTEIILPATAPDNSLPSLPPLSLDAKGQPIQPPSDYNAQNYSNYNYMYNYSNYYGYPYPQYQWDYNSQQYYQPYQNYYNFNYNANQTQTSKPPPPPTNTVQLPVEEKPVSKMNTIAVDDPNRYSPSVEMDDDDITKETMENIKPEVPIEHPTQSVPILSNPDKNDESKQKQIEQNLIDSADKQSVLDVPLNTPIIQPVIPFNTQPLSYNTSVQQSLYVANKPAQVQPTVAISTELPNQQPSVLNGKDEMLEKTIKGSSVLGKNQAKKRLMAFSMMKQKIQEQNMAMNDSHNSDLGDANDSEFVPDLNIFQTTTKKKPVIKKAVKVIKAEQTIEQIEEMKKTELMQGNNTALYQQLLLSGGNEAPILQKLGIESLTGKYSASIRNQSKRSKRHHHERHRDDSRRSHRYRRHSRSKSRSRSLEKPKMKALDVQNWKDFLNSGFNFDKFRKYKFDELEEKKEIERKSRVKKKHGDSHSSDRDRNKEYISADTEKVIGDHKRYNILERKKEFQKSVVVKSLEDNQTKDFPSYIIQYTKTEPVVKYSRNPAKAVCHLMNRQQLFETLLPEIEAIVQKFLLSMKPKKMKENCIDLHYYEVNDKILTLMKNKNVYPFKGWWPKLPFIVTQVKENPNVEIDMEEHMNKFSASKRVKKSRFNNESFVVDLRPTVPSKWDSDYDGSPVIDKSMDVEVAQPLNTNSVTTFIQEVQQDLNNKTEMMDTTSDAGGGEEEPLIEINVTPVALSKDKTQDHTKLDNEYEEFLKIVTAEKFEKKSTDNVKPVVLPTHCIQLNDSVHEESDDDSLSKSSEDSVSLKDVKELIDSKIVKKLSSSNKKMKKKKKTVNKKLKKKENKKKRRKSSSSDSSCDSDSVSDSSTSDSETDTSDTSSSVEIKKRKKKSKDKKKKKSKPNKKKGKEDKSKNKLPDDNNSSILNLIEKAFNVEIKKKDDSEEPKQRKKKRKHTKKEDKQIDSTEDEFQKVKECLKETFTKLVKPDTVNDDTPSLSNCDNSTVSEVLKYLKMNEEKEKKSKKSKKSKRKHELDESEEEITPKKLRIEEIFNTDETDKKKKSKKKKSADYKEIVSKKKSKKKTKKPDLSKNEEGNIDKKKQKKSKKDKDKDESEDFFGLRPNEWNIINSNSMRGVVHCSDTNLTDFKSIIKGGGSKNKKQKKHSKNKLSLSSDEEKFVFTKKTKSDINSKKKSNKSKSDTAIIKRKSLEKRKNNKNESSDDGNSMEFNSDSETSFNNSDDFKKTTSTKIRINKKSSDSELEEKEEEMFINNSIKPGKNEKDKNESLDYQSMKLNLDSEISFNTSDDLKNTTSEKIRISKKSSDSEQEEKEVKMFIKNSNKPEKNKKSKNESLDHHSMEFNSDSETSFNKSNDLKYIISDKIKINKKSSVSEADEKEKEFFTNNSNKLEKNKSSLGPDKNDKFSDKSDNFKCTQQTHNDCVTNNLTLAKPIVVVDNISHRDKVKMNLMKLSTAQHIPFIGFGLSPSLGFIKSKQLQVEKHEETKIEKSKLSQMNESQLQQSKQHKVGICQSLKLNTVIPSKIDTQVAFPNSIEDSDSNQSSIVSSDSSELKSPDKEKKKHHNIEELESKCLTNEDKIEGLLSYTDTTDETSSNNNIDVDEIKEEKVINQINLNESEISQGDVINIIIDEQLNFGVSKPAIDVEMAKDNSYALSTYSPNSDSSNIDLQIAKSNNELVTQWTSDWNNLDQIIGKNKSNEVMSNSSRAVRKNKSRWDKHPSPGNAYSNVSLSDTNITCINSTDNQEQNALMSMLDVNEKTCEEISSIDCVNVYESYDYSENWSTEYENYQSCSEIPQYSEMVAIEDDSLNPVDYSVYEDYSPNSYSYQEEFSFWSQQDISQHSNQLSGESLSIQVGNVLEILPSDDVSNDETKQLETEEIQSETEMMCTSNVLDKIEESEIPVQTTHDEQFFELYSQHFNHYSKNPIQYSVTEPVVNEVIGSLPDTLEEIPEDETNDQDSKIPISLRSRAYSAIVEDGSNVLYITSDNYIAYCAIEDKCMVHIAVEVCKHDSVKDEVRHCFNINENGTVDEYWLHANLIQFNTSSDGESGVFSSDDDEKSLNSECDQEIDENELAGVEWEIVDGDSDSSEEWLNDPNVLSQYGGDDVDQNIIETSYVSSSDYDTEDSDLSEENCDTENITAEENSSTTHYEIKDSLNVFECSKANEDSLGDHKDDSLLIQQAVSNIDLIENCTNIMKPDNDTSTPEETVVGSDKPNKEHETGSINNLGTNKEEVLVQDLEQMNIVIKQKLMIQKLRLRTKLKSIEKQSDTALVSYSDNMETVKHPFIGLFQPPTISILRENRTVETLKKKVMSKRVLFADGISPGDVLVESPVCDNFDRPFSPPSLKALMRETLKMKRYVYPFRKSKKVRSKVTMTTNSEPIKIPPLSQASSSSNGDYYVSRRHTEEECVLDTANSNGTDSPDSDSDQNDNGRTTPPKPTRQVTPVPSDDDDCSWNNESIALDSEPILP